MRDFFSFLRFFCEIELIPMKFLCDFCEIPTFHTCPNRAATVNLVENKGPVATRVAVPLRRRRLRHLYGFPRWSTERGGACTRTPSPSFLDAFSALRFCSLSPDFV